MTQTDIVLSMLRARPDGITALDALREAGCFRLAARIHELRRMGESIHTAYHVRNGKQVAVYTLGGKAI